MAEPYAIGFECSTCGTSHLRMKCAYVGMRTREGVVVPCIIVDADCEDCGRNERFPISVPEMLGIKSLTRWVT